MKQIKSWMLDKFNILRCDSKLKKNIFMLSVALLILLILVPLKGAISGGKYVLDDNNAVVEIRMSEQGLYELILEIESGGEVEKRDISINREIKKEVDKSKEEAAREELEVRNQRELEISNIIKEIEETGESRVKLPALLSDGSKLRWYRNSDVRSMMPIIIALYFFVVIAIVKDSLDTAKKPHSTRNIEVVRALPRFVNQVVMLMDAGMILSDTIFRITDSYRIIPETGRGALENMLIEICDSEDVAGSKMQRIHDFARSNRIKEMVRITTILLENERRGADARENLRRESEFLWETRKITAEEKGKAIDAKMAMPLGLLLILLIVITMAPALMSM